ncbi:MAG: 2-amino-4-hydroxy-6-hydroxymethyldihydropteridine diphosphokinase [Brevinematales bacterium]
MPITFIGIGSNLEDRKKHIRKALEYLSMLGKNLYFSHVYRTKPYGVINQPDFINMVVRMETNLSPEELLVHLLQIEKQLGRVRTEKWGPRTIDLDILFYDQVVIHTPHLLIPHPDLQNRLFVLRPLMDIDPSFVHPKLGKTIAELWQELMTKDYQMQETKS